MKIYNLRIYGKHKITGKGTVFTVHRDENQVKDIDKGDFVITNDDRKLYEITGIECFKNNFGEIGKNIGVLVKEVQHEDFTVNAVWHDKYYHHFGIHPTLASMYGDKPEDIVELTLRVSDDQSIPGANREYMEPDYCGWLRADDQKFHMIYSERFLLDMCFPAGIKGTEEMGQGKAYRLEIVDTEK